ncbi:MAG: nucleotidyltransferase family protein [Armatimonadetes bacterium]|nr:nucleotidyltransferase family protein [Armatimonadota bacterium]
MTLEELRERRDEILAAAARHGASNIRVFGSVARGDAGPGSDVDILVRFAQGRSWRDHVDLYGELAALLGCPVSLVTDRSVAYWQLGRMAQEAVEL